MFVPRQFGLAGRLARPAALDEFSLASRLSYFLWSSMPDEDLFDLAEQGQLSQPETLREQVERMLRDPKAKAFTENFAGQWLGLRDIDATLPDRQLYPEYDDLLRSSMIKEVYLFFEEVLKNDLSLTNFVSSDFSIINGRLANHYGIPGVKDSIPQSLAAGEQSPRRGHDDGCHHEGDGQRHDYLADRARGLGPRPPPGDSASQASRSTWKQSSPTSAARRRSANQLAKHRQSEAVRVAT